MLWRSKSFSLIKAKSGAGLHLDHKSLELEVNFTFFHELGGIKLGESHVLNECGFLFPEAKIETQNQSKI